VIEKLKQRNLVKFTKLASLKSHLMPLSGLSIKTEYNLSEESSSSNCSPTMVETTSPLLRVRPISPSPRLSPQSQNFLNSKMLISSQNLSYFEQRLSRNSSSDQKKIEMSEKHMNGNSSSATSLFTIDSILAKQTRYSDTSPSSSPNQENNMFKNGFAETSPSRSTRLPPAALFQHHPGLHITHLASNFGSPEFLGETRRIPEIQIRNKFASPLSGTTSGNCNSLKHFYSIFRSRYLHFRLTASYGFMYA
jgi:hypothetical protein